MFFNPPNKPIKGLDESDITIIQTLIADSSLNELERFVSGEASYCFPTKEASYCFPTKEASYCFPTKMKCNNTCPFKVAKARNQKCPPPLRGSNTPCWSLKGNRRRIISFFYRNHQAELMKLSEEKKLFIIKLITGTL